MSESKWTKMLAIAAAVVAVILLIDNNLKKKKITELEKEIEDNDKLNIEIKKRLIDFINNYKGTESKVVGELEQILKLIESKQEPKAILSLAKIIENLLKDLYKADPEFKAFPKLAKTRVVFADYIEFAKHKKIINNEDYHLLSVLKIIRNEEAHELDVKKEKSRIVACFLAGISFIILLYKLISEKNIKEEIA
jgi:hypothetical protein